MDEEDAQNAHLETRELERMHTERCASLPESPVLEMQRCGRLQVEAHEYLPGCQWWQMADEGGREVGDSVSGFNGAMWKDARTYVCAGSSRWLQMWVFVRISSIEYGEILKLEELADGGRYRQISVGVKVDAIVRSSARTDSERQHTSRRPPSRV